MWIKICANTSVEDAQAAIDLGADAVGFVFAPSSRRVTPEQAGAIIRGLIGQVERIGVFPALGFEAVRDAVRVARLSGVQLHGGYDRAMPRRLRAEFGAELTIAQTLHWTVCVATSSKLPGKRVAEALLDQVREMMEDGHIDRILVDSKVGSALGGTGQAFDWGAAETLFEQAAPARLIVAGGLKPENVGEAIGRLQPWGVDVASGVESEPGRKDPERLRLFLERARAATRKPTL